MTKRTPPDDPRVTSEVRARLVEVLAEHRLAGMFGDGLEREYVMGGFPTTKGLALMTGAELIEEVRADLCGTDCETFHHVLLAVGLTEGPCPKCRQEAV